VADDPIIAVSARKHGLSDEDIGHAYRNPIRIFDLDDGLIMIIGPTRVGAMLEIGIVDGDTDAVVVHAMQARDRFLG